MMWLKRVGLFLLVNFLVVAVISFFLYIFNIQPYLTHYGINYPSLALFCLIWGMGGAFISLALSKVMAKWMVGLEIIDPNDTRQPYAEIRDTIYDLATKAGLSKMPEVGIYDSPELNAFATGPSRSNSLVAVSTGLIRKMNKGELEGVLGHEITHIANGDMVTMTLLQGVINAFVMFLARIVASLISGFGRDRDSQSSIGSAFSYQITVFVLEMVFMVLGTLVVAKFSRFREFRADTGGATLSSPQNMIAALQVLKRNYEIADPQTDQPSLQTLKISSKSSIVQLFSTHPPLDERIGWLERKFKLRK